MFNRKAQHKWLHFLSASVALMILGYGSAFGQTITGVSSSDSPYIVPVAPGVITWSIATVGDDFGGYRLVGIPDGTGAFNNGDGTFTWLVNHELRNSQGVPRAHSTDSGGAFVSKWVINGFTGDSSSILAVQNGEDLIQQIVLWNPETNSFDPPAKGAVLNRLCSADLPLITAFYNPVTGRGHHGRIYMNGEEYGEGRGFAHVIDGAEAGISYQLPHLGRFAWENSIAHPNTGDNTVVIGLDDSRPGQLYVYVGTKKSEGSTIDKAGLTNGRLYGIRVDGIPEEMREVGIPTGTRFTLHGFGNVTNMTGEALEMESSDAGVTLFLRPEDGAWDPNRPNDFYFVTTDRFDETQDAIGTAIGRSRLYRLRFDDASEPTLGGQVDRMTDGTAGVMFDNMTIDRFGNVLIQEDPGRAPRTAKIWQYNIPSDTLKIIAQHDPGRFGDISADPVPPFTTNEESSGIIDAWDILGPGWFLLNAQAHARHEDPELVEYGQLLALFNPDSAAAGLIVDATNNVFFQELEAGLNMISLPLKPSRPHTARSFMREIGATTIIQLEAKNRRFVGFTAADSGDGFPIEGGMGYIVNTPQARIVTYVGGAWRNTPAIAAAPSPETQARAWAFIVAANTADIGNMTVSVHNPRTNSIETMAATASSGNSYAIWADLTRRSVVEVGDVLAIQIQDEIGQVVGTLNHEISTEDIRRAFVQLHLTPESLRPTQTMLFANYPNPFNPETWLPYQLAQSANVQIRIYNTTGNLVRNMDLGFQAAGYYLDKSRAAYWDGRNNLGEHMASGVYFYQLIAGDYIANRKLVILK